MKKLVLSLLLAGAQSALAMTEGTLVVHEWGTFTSVQGSNGQVLGGMNHEEEQLPSFVGGRDVLSEPFHKRCRFSKVIEVCDDTVVGPVIHANDVTQKMETPVIYFHSDRPRHVTVNVGFPKGIVSQYFPRPLSFYPEIGRASSLTGGYVSFGVDLSLAPLALPQVAASSVYKPARQVDANYVASNGENEKFIFYRGLGNFTTELNVTSDNGGNLSVNNSSSSNYVPAAFLIEVTASGSSVMKLGGLTAGGSISITPEQLQAFRQTKQPEEQFLNKALPALNAALQQQGLYKDEAEAMTNTWKNSYFRNPGLRVLYVLSRAETDKLLPLTMDPQPQELVRTLVGRVEVITNAEEAAMSASLEKDLLYPGTLGRFAEPKLRRLIQLTRDQALIDKINAMIARIQ
ncbi:MAG: hypothetical protein ACXVA9_02440 [Bdellovibrionales bacterium]